MTPLEHYTWEDRDKLQRVREHLLSYPVAVFAYKGNWQAFAILDTVAYQKVEGKIERNPESCIGIFSCCGEHDAISRLDDTMQNIIDNLTEAGFIEVMIRFRDKKPPLRRVKKD